MKGNIRLTVDERGSFILIKIHGELSERTATQFKNRALAEIDEHGHKHMVVDCSECDYMNSVGIGVLSMIGKKLQDIGGRLGLIDPSDAVRDVLSVTSNDPFIKEYKSLDEAAEDA